MTFREWFQAHWRQPGETTTDALQRLSAKHSVSYKSLFYAEKGCRCSPSTAKRIEAFTGGRVLAAQLVLLPTRAELGVGRREVA